MRVRLFFLLVLCGLVAGCASGAKSDKQTPAGVAAKLDPSSPAALTLAQITPAVVLAEIPTSQPAGRPPIEAVTLYAQATDALQTGRRFTAIGLLQKAIELDPQSFELNYALGKAHLIGRTNDEQSVAAMEKAAAIRPDHLELQTDLGRQYLVRGDQANALKHLRLAVQTTEYGEDEPAAPMADLFLARALQQSGYDRAALEQYAKLLRRVQGASLRNNPHLAFLITDRLYIDIGDLYARNGQFEDALAAFEPAAKRDPADFEIEARVVRSLVGLRRSKEASRRAAEAVVRFRASKESLDLLREVHRDKRGKTAGAADALAAMYAERPKDITVLFALVEMLQEDGRWKKADDLLAAHGAQSRNDFAVVRRRVQLRLQRDDIEYAARLLVQTLADRPDDSAQVESLWADLVTPARENHIQLKQIQALHVSPAQAAAKEVCVAAVANSLRRSTVADQAIERAVKITPPFAPAFRKQIIEIWQRSGSSAEQKNAATEDLVKLAASGGNLPLGEELRGLSLLYRKQPKEAAEVLGKLIDSGQNAPSLLHAHALAVRAAGDTAKFEQIMWKLLSDRPAFEDAYATLYAYYSDSGSEAQATRVLTQWDISIPYSSSARILLAASQFRAGKTEAAETRINALMKELPGDMDVLRTAAAFYGKSARTAELTGVLEQQIKDHPANLPALSLLVDLYEVQSKSTDLIPALDAARMALAGDPDHLYVLAHLYARVKRVQTNEDVLQQVLAIEPMHPPASNDLGYSWAERGEKLPNAESLIRQAVTAEPENLSFLDSLGWVLYKQGKFAEARPNLEKAIGDGSQTDPTVLDHLGDVLYRLNDKDGAGKQWNKANTRIEKLGGARDDLKELKTTVERKSKQLEAGEPVTVSPAVEEAKQAQK